MKIKDYSIAVIFTTLSLVIIFCDLKFHHEYSTLEGLKFISYWFLIVVPGAILYFILLTLAVKSPNSKLIFILLCICVFVCNYFFVQLLNNLYYEFEEISINIEKLINHLQKVFLPSIAIVGFQYFSNYIKELKAKKKLTQNLLGLELQLQNNYLNVHFIFNLVNNLYAQYYLNTAEFPNKLNYFSDILDYLLVKSHLSKIKFTEETLVLETFLHLTQYPVKTTLNIEDKYNLKNKIYIQPGIILHLVENLNKHCHYDDLIHSKIDLLIQPHFITIVISNPCRFSKINQISGLDLINSKLTSSSPTKNSCKFYLHENNFFVNLQLPILY